MPAQTMVKTRDNCSKNKQPPIIIELVRGIRSKVKKNARPRSRARENRKKLLLLFRALLNPAANKIDNRLGKGVAFFGHACLVTNGQVYKFIE